MWLLSCLLVLFVPRVGDCKHSTGSISVRKRLATENLYLYYDSSDQWPAVYKTNTNCSQKEWVLQEHNYQIMNLTTTPTDDWFFAGCYDSVRDGEEWFTCEGVRRFSSYRERWWYIALGNCRGDRLFLDYEFWMFNGNEDDIWFYHFSADEFYILPTDLAFLLANLLCLVVAIAIAVILRARQMFHVTYKLFMTSIVLECVSLFCDCVYGGAYARNGRGVPFLKLTGQMSRAAGTLVFILMLILMGKGYTITRGRLSKSGSLKVAIFMTVFTVVYATLYIYQIRFFDPGEVLYVYDSPAGYGIVSMRLLGWIWFCYAIYFTLVHYPEKRGFYYRFSTFYSIWFWMGPMVIILSNHVFPNWMREKIVNGVENAVVLLGFLAFMVITRPSAANQNFPYHVRTTQIDVLNREQDDEERSVELPHHAYELQMQKLDDIFTVAASRNHSAVSYRKPVDVVFETNRGGGSPVPTAPLNPQPPPAYDELLTVDRERSTSAAVNA